MQKDDTVSLSRCEIVTCVSCHFVVQEFLVAVGLRGATLQHRVLPSGLSWHEQVRLLLFAWLHLQF